MAKYTTTSGQTIFDLSLQLYGDSSNVVKIMNENPQLNVIAGVIPAGTVIDYTPRVGFSISQYFTDKVITVNTGTANPLQGSGFDLGFKINAFS